MAVCQLLLAAGVECFLAVGRMHVQTRITFPRPQTHVDLRALAFPVQGAYNRPSHFCVVFGRGGVMTVR